MKAYSADMLLDIRADNDEDCERILDRLREAVEEVEGVVYQGSQVYEPDTER